MQSRLPGPVTLRDIDTRFELGFDTFRIAGLCQAL
jgi:hypothetical protein